MSGLSTTGPPRFSHVLFATGLILGLTALASVAPFGALVGASPRNGGTPAGPVLDPYGNQLSSISCSAPTSCIAVGSYKGLYKDQFVGGTLAESWDGSSWSRLDTPDPALAGLHGLVSSFSDVSCSSPTFCVAVGTSVLLPFVYTLAEVWNGSEWSITATPDHSGVPSELSGVSCTSPTFCIAIGYDGDSGDVQPLAEEWDGSTWTQMTVPVPAGTDASYPLKIDCVSEVFCVAVGTFSETGSTNSFNLIDEFEGTVWSSVDAPNPTNTPQPALSGISCASATSCVAIGSLFAVVLNGTTWSVEDVPDVNGDNQDQLGGISCTSTTSCTAVGGYENSKNKSFAQEATWDGDAWTVQSTASLTKGTSSGLKGVACLSSSSCLAVGSETVKTHPETALLEQGAGGTWAVQAAPTVAPLTLSPDSGDPGTKVTVSGYGFSPDSAVKVTFDGKGGFVALCRTTTDASGTYSCTATIPTRMAGSSGTRDVLAKSGNSLEELGLFALT